MRLLYCSNPTQEDVDKHNCSAGRNARFYSGEVESCATEVVYFEGEFDPSAYKAAKIKVTAKKAPNRNAAREAREAAEAAAETERLAEAKAAMDAAAAALSGDEAK